mmetsp:Transcript_9216/g.13470  ORF Transcript_9216/g.13470 Transcript_9216/m.13470 type:complete len:224 (-) Transcript_9216:768-1439(-)
MDLETNLSELIMVKNITSIKDKGGFHHRSVDLFIVKRFEFIPLGQYCQSMCSITCRIRICGGCDTIFHMWGVGRIDTTGIIHLSKHVFTLDLWVKYVNIGSFQKEITHYKHRWSFTHVTCVFFKGKSKDANFLARDSIEHLTNHFLRKSFLLVVVHDDYLIPVLRTLMKAVCFTQIHEVKNILLETGSSKSNGCLEEPFSNSIIHTNSATDLRYISTSAFAKG